MADNILQSLNCRRCAAEMVEKSSALITSIEKHRVVFVCKKCGIETVVTAKE
jgi:RNase P subunit RPR2